MESIIAGLARKKSGAARLKIQPILASSGDEDPLVMFISNIDQLINRHNY